MFRALSHHTTPAQARQARRLISRQFGVPIRFLLAQLDIRQGEDRPTVFYDAESHLVSKNDDRSVDIEVEAARQMHVLSEQVNPFLNGYFVGRRSASR